MKNLNTMANSLSFENFKTYFKYIVYCLFFFPSLVFSSHTFTSTNTVNVIENTTSVLTVTAIKDGGSTLTFSISGGADSAFFSITSDGVLTFNTAPDYENPSDSGNDNTYEVIVQASNNQPNATATQTIMVTVTNDTTDDAGITVNPIEDLCYKGSDGEGNQCILIDGFYYGPSGNHNCLATVIIENNGSSDITSVEVIKAYDENIENFDDCGIDGTSGNCELNTSLSEYGAYGGGIIYTLGDLDANTSKELYDEDTYGGDVNNITLFGSYQKDDINYSGEIPICPGGGMEVDIADFTAHVDIVDDYSYNGSTYIPWIKTKVSQKDGYAFKAVYLGTGDAATGLPQTYAETYNNPNQASSITVLGKLVDMTGNTCDTATPVNLFTTIGGNDPVVAIIDAGETADLSNSFVMAYSPDQIVALSKRDIRFKYKAIDFNAVLDYAGVQCATRSSTGGVVEGIPACLIANENDNNANMNTAIENYIKVFGYSAYENCYTENGQPCYASNGGVGEYPYNHEYGCFECSIGAAPYTCSQDNFAIRPDHFNITATDPDFPNLLRAGEDYNHTVYAYDYGINAGATGSLDYNQTGGAGGNLDLNQSRFMATGALDDGTLLGDLVWSAWDFNMTNGISNQNGDLSVTEVAGVQYDDVGKINLRVEDREWASVDINNPNDPTPHDCSPDGAYLCGDRNVTYIPHHFRFEELNITNHAGPTSNFTYIADNRGMPSTTPPTRSPMAARVQTRIEALNKNNLITRNFRTGNLYYENPITVTQVVKVPAFGNPNGYLYPDANETNITNQLIGFGRPGFDDNGTRNIAWDEDTYPLEFNFQREINEEANPFDVDGSYLSIFMHSYYTDPDDGDTADISGSRLGDWDNAAAITACASDPGCVQANAENNATFYYARTRSSKPFYDDIVHPGPVTTPIFVDVYCDLGYTACDALGIDTVNGQISDTDWWLSWEHSKSQGDGNITLTATSNGTVSAPPKPNIDASGGADKTVTVTHTATTLPDIVDIDFVTDDSAANFTNAWLIYNPDNPWVPSPFYRVRFIGATTGWAGHGDTGYVVGGSSNIQKNNRLEW